MIGEVHAGRTRTGKVITYPADPGKAAEGLAGFEALEDDFDAFAFFRYLAHEQRKVDSRSVMLKAFTFRMRFFHEAVREVTSLKKYKLKLGIKNEKDLLEFGKKRQFKLRGSF